jgi:hypothetical protein
MNYKIIQNLYIYLIYYILYILYMGYKYQGLPGSTRVYQGLQGLPGSTRVYMVYQGLQGSTRVYKGLQGLPGSTRVYRVYKGLRVHPHSEVYPFVAPSVRAMPFCGTLTESYVILSHPQSDRHLLIVCFHLHPHKNHAYQGRP